MFVVKDLVVDMTNFYTQYKTIDPYLKRKTPKVNLEIYPLLDRDQRVSPVSRGQATPRRAL